MDTLHGGISHGCRRRLSDGETEPIGINHRLCQYVSDIFAHFIISDVLFLYPKRSQSRPLVNGAPSMRTAAHFL
ncbi:hypothetical protein D3C85_1880290 [compost metagenome]